MPNKPSTFRPHGQTRKQVEQSWASRRDEKRAVYASPAWRALRVSVVIRDNYLCQKCLNEGRLTAVCLNAKRGTEELMAIVDHKEPAQTAADVICDPSNLWTLCPSCASTKTAAEDGGFSNTTKHGGRSKSIGHSAL